MTSLPRILFIDRDGTLIKEPADEQIDSLEKLQFVPGMFRNLGFIASHTDFELVMVTNQDGLGTPCNPEEKFWPLHKHIMKALEGEGIRFKAVHIDRHFPEDNSPMRKPGTGMLTEYMGGAYNLAESYVIGDRETDALLARNLGCRALILANPTITTIEGTSTFSSTGCTEKEGNDGVRYVDSWDRVAEILFDGERKATVHRKTNETDIEVSLSLDGDGHCDINTGLGFFDHMLEQIGRHGNIDLNIRCKGDLHVDEHHTIEDTALALGEALLLALGSKRGIERYGYTLPMDDCLCQVALDFGGRPWLVWEADFQRERIGEMPTEMFFHFFKSLSDAARMNLNIRAEGTNEHHKIEGIFKALARSLKMAVRRDIYHYNLPSSKGTL